MPPEPDPPHGSAVRYVDSGFPLVYENLKGRVAGIHTEMWKEALKGREIEWMKKTEIGGFDLDKYGYFGGMMGELQNGTLDVAMHDLSMQQTRMKLLRYTLPIEDAEENFYERRAAVYDPTIIVVPFTWDISTILIVSIIALTATELVVKAILEKWGRREGPFWISCHWFVLATALFRRVSTILLVVIHLQRRLRWTRQQLRSRDYSMYELFGTDFAHRHLLAIQDIEQKQNLLCHQPNMIYFGKIHSITHNDPEKKYKQQCEFKIIDSSNLDFQLPGTDIEKRNIGRSVPLAFFMNPKLPRRFKETFNQIRLKFFRRDQIENFWWRRFSNRPRIEEKQPPIKHTYKVVSLGAFKIISIIIAAMYLGTILVFIIEVTSVRRRPRTERDSRIIRFIRAII